jgi:hypothetical protein
MLHRASDFDGFFETTWDMTFGMWNLMNLCRAGSLKMVASKLAKYVLDIVALQ